MKEILNHLFEHNKLSRTEAKEVLINISAGKYNTAQVAVFMGVFMMRSVSVEELRGFREALLDLCVPVEFPGSQSIDLCGTGGDGKNTFNISTLTSLVVAGAGLKVTKHGNYGVSSVCGSSNVLEYFGYRFTNKEAELQEQLHETNICFLHAPLFHPAMKFVGPIRRDLGVKTFFNMLGPLVNPAKPPVQMIGVFSLELARLYKYLMEEDEVQYAIIHALDGYDEISLTEDVLVMTKKDEMLYRAKDFGVASTEPKAIYGGNTIEEAAGIFRAVLENTANDARRHVVLANAAVALFTAGYSSSLNDCYDAAEASLVSGRAINVFNKVITLSQKQSP